MFTLRNMTSKLLLASLSALILFGCANDRVDSLQRELNKLKNEIKEQKEQGTPSIKLGLESSNSPLTSLDFFPGEARDVSAQLTDLEALDVSVSNPMWHVSLNTETGVATITAPVDIIAGSTRITFSAIDAKGLVYQGRLVATLLDYSDPKGTFVLNEGSAWSRPTEMGSLIYISPRKSAVPNVYVASNGRPLGEVTQDLFATNDKIYVVAQNPNPATDGQLTVIDARTLQHIAHYSDALSNLSWPTHLAVIGEQAYIRDNSGLWRLDLTLPNEAPVMIEGSRRARKNVMLVSKGKLFFTIDNKVAILDPETNQIIKGIEFAGNVSGLAHADDSHLYVSYYDTEGKIAKLSSATLEVVSTNSLGADKGGDLLKASFAAAPSITAKGDTLYYSGLSSKIYRHIYSTQATALMVDTKESLNPDHTVTYNTVTVHPVTGQVYFNTLKGFGQAYKTNTIYCFDMTGEKAVLLNRFEDLTRFPAGIFFPEVK